MLGYRHDGRIYMKTQYTSVRLQSLVSVSDKAYKAKAHDGSEDIIPKSCVLGRDYEVGKCEAYWIASWILPKKHLTYSNKKKRWFDEQGKELPSYTIEHHDPEIVAAVDDNSIDELKR